ncbi:MaoC/PaaZ C-terminal domain-containing protein [Halocatena halophila]|uniref:MaoC/PaaZ C-terminal domain-containing protein n=1 Tax=Halocatena halophila TaxID=2814576 RepID=UPI002ED26062
MIDGLFEEVSIGETHEASSYTVEKEEMLSFAEKYDPQPFHVNEEAAKDSIFGGLVASGLYTYGITQKMAVHNIVNGAELRGAIGIDNLRWKQPVRPEDILSIKIEPVDKEPQSDDIGIVSMSTQTINQDNEEVFTGVMLLRYQRTGEA